MTAMTATAPRTPPLATAPALLLSLDRVEELYHRLTRALPEVTLHYAVKANPDPWVLRRLSSLGSHFDVASPTEVRAALAAGATGPQLLSTNPVQTRAAIADEHDAGVRTFVVDSADEIGKLAAVALGVSVLIRLATSGQGSDWPLTGKFGADPDEVVGLFDLAARVGLRPAGVAFHVGSQQREPQRWVAPIATSAEIFARLSRLGHSPWLLDIGGGFPAAHRDTCPPIERYGRVIDEAVHHSFGRRRPTLIAEPGRGLVADAGVLEAQVMGITQRGGQRWVYLTSGIYGGLTEAVDEAIHYRISTTAAPGPAAPAVLAGPSCDSADVIYRSVPLPLTLAEGDLVRFHGAGVYTTSYATTFNGFDKLATRYVEALP